MAIDARFEGGPRHGKKATLRNTDHAPKHIACDAKPYNMPEGKYVHAEVETTTAGSRHLYKWVNV